MKKITLMMVAALVSVSAMAIGVQKRASIKNIIGQQSKVLTYPIQNSFMQNNAVSMISNNKTVEKLKAVKPLRKDDTAVETTPLIKAEESKYTEYAGGFAYSYPMLETEYFVDGNTIYLQIDNYIVLEGTIGVGENELEDYGYDVITFKAGEVMATNTQTGANYVAKACTYNSATYSITPNDNDIVGYIYEDGKGYAEIYVPDIVALVYEPTNEVLYGEADMWLFTQDILEENVFVANVSGTDYSDNGGEYSLEGKAFYYNSYSDGTLDILVKGINNWDEEAWACVNLSADQTTAAISNYQYVGTYSWSSLGASADFITAAYGAPDDEGYVHLVSDGVTMNVTDDGENTIFTAGDAATYYTIGYFDDDHSNYSGIYSKGENLKIVITNEETEVSGIKNVTVANKITSNGAVYNLAGQKVGKNFKGIVVKDGKKYIQK